MPPAKILSFEVSPNLLPSQGGEVSLSWESEEATSGMLLANGEIIVESLWPITKGDLEWEVYEPTTFELVVKGDESEDRREASVELGEDMPLIVSFTASPSEIERGESALLRWKTENVEAVEVRDGAGQSLDLGGAQPGEGALGVRPTETTTYTLVASLGDEEVQATVELSVIPVELEVVSFAQVEDRARFPGEEVELRWVVRGADSLQISNMEGETLDIAEEHRAMGTAVLTMGEEGNFHLVATQDDQSVEETLRIVLLTPPSIASVYALPPAVTEPSGSATLHWSGVERAHTLTLEREPGEPMDISGHGLESGSVEVEIHATTTFTLVAENLAGEARQDYEVELVPPPSLLSFSATPARVGMGESFTLAWETEDAAYITVEDENGALDSVSDWMLNHQVDLQIVDDMEYTLRAYNAADEFVEERLTVTVGAPEILSATFTPPFVAPGQPAELEWEALGGTQLRVLDAADAELCATTDAEEIAQGSCTITSPLADGEHAYTLRIENGMGDSSEIVSTLVVGEGPFIVGFEADPFWIEEGEEVEFSWLVLEDPTGVPMTVTLSDGSSDFVIPESEQRAGSELFLIEDPGSYEFTLTAASANGSHQRSVEVEVFGLPTATLLASTSVYEGEDPITLSWTSEYAAGGLVLYEVEAGGQPVELYEVPEAERGSGSFDVEPAADTTYRIVADNGVGSTATAETSVTIGPPVILSFTANPLEVVAGDEVTLEWTTRLADEVELDLSMQVEEVSGDPFASIAASGTALPLTGGCGWQLDPLWGWVQWPPEDEGCGMITLPAGFEFPLGGDAFGELQVYANGAIGFDFAYDEITFWNLPLPTSDFPVQIAPMWDDHDPAEVWYEFGTDADGQFVVVEWNSEIYGFTTELEFQAVLRDDGSITFRYGSMSGVGDEAEGMANGSSATIGYQSTDGSEWAMVHFGALGADAGQAMPGGLSHRTWRISNSYEPNDSLRIQPLESRSITLTAHGQGGEASETVDIIVHEAPEVAVAQPPEEPQAGWDFELGWTSENATSLEVIDDGGTVRCAAAPEEVEEGACLLMEATPGIYEYTVRAHGALGSVAEELVSIEVFTTFVLESFEADFEAVEAGDPVTLSWLTHGADTIALTANGVDILPAGASPDAGAATHAPTEHTTYLLSLEAADGRVRTAEVEVEVKTLDLSASLAPETIQAGQSTSLSWNVTPLGSGTPTVYLPMTETITAFEDISTEPGVVELQGAGSDDARTVHVFADGFEFPFGGELHSEVQVITNGFITFDMSSTTTSVLNYELPRPGSANVHLAPFWDDLHTQSSGRILALSKSDGSYVIQWSNMSKWAGSSSTNEWDLNFQIVLFPDGAFEFRYGTMSQLAITSSTCASGDCYLDAQGASATIGYQNPSASVGYTHHFGGGSQSDSNVPFPNGLEWRAFRMQGGASGSMTLHPQETSTYQVCAELGDYATCEEVEVEVQSP